MDHVHFGEIVHRVDMRGEVGLLTRNVVIQGEVEDTCPQGNGNCDVMDDIDSFGGHIKVRGIKLIYDI